MLTAEENFDNALITWCFQSCSSADNLLARFSPWYRQNQRQIRYSAAGWSPGLISRLVWLGRQQLFLTKPTTGLILKRESNGDTVKELLVAVQTIVLTTRVLGGSRNNWQTESLFAWRKIITTVLLLNKRDVPASKSGVYREASRHWKKYSLRHWKKEEWNEKVKQVYYWGRLMRNIMRTSPRYNY